MSFFSNLTSHLNLIPALSAAIQEIKLIGGSKETAVQKVGQIIEVSAAVGEIVPVPIVSAVSATVEEIAQMIFNTGTRARGAGGSRHSNPCQFDHVYPRLTAPRKKERPPENHRRPFHCSHFASATAMSSQGCGGHFSLTGWALSHHFRPSTASTEGSSLGSVTPCPLGSEHGVRDAGRVDGIGPLCASSTPPDTGDASI